MKSQNTSPAFDLIIVGFGAAATAAAITAADMGASVLILEKQARLAHTPNTRMSGGAIMGVNDVGRATQYLDHCAGGMVPTAVSRAWALKAKALPGWLERNRIAEGYQRISGGEHIKFENVDAIDVYLAGKLKDGTPIDYSTANPMKVALGYAPKPDGLSPNLRAGPELWMEMLRAVAGRKVEVFWETPAERLLTDGAGAVTGVQSTKDGQKQHFYARKGVVLASGGYEFDDEIKLQFLKAPMHFYGNPGNTGDGVRLAQSVGASLWHMNLAIGRGIGHFNMPDGTHRNFTLYMAPGGYLITDRSGRRYANEFPQAELGHAFLNEMIHFDSNSNEYPRIPSYWLFDSRRIQGGPLTGSASGLTGVGLYQWSADNSVEIGRGWISRGNSPKEAAEKAGMRDPAAAEREVGRYNDACASGKDEFGRPPASLVPLDKPPYFCVAMHPGGSNTCGGPRRDSQGRILDAFETPIPGLFGAGELGQVIGMLYPAAGANLSEALCWGQIAAESALQGLHVTPAAAAGAS
jgi:succinate dehydrogenase/fumarate reductase flavoprotein subunit